MLPECRQPCGPLSIRFHWRNSLRQVGLDVTLVMCPLQPCADHDRATGEGVGPQVSDGLHCMCSC